MTSIKKTFLCAGLALMLSACATSYDTEKQFWSFGKGFETAQIAPDSWQISFVGNTNTDRALARKYVMRKSAELCKQAGYSYFTFTREQTDRDAVGQFGVGKNSSNDILWGSSTMNQETSVMVEVTGLHSKPENTSSRIYDTDYILNNVDVKG
ncbi:hypothetical protein G3496_00205 [Shewanella baltica]|uniref:Lipoprotein n=1 Tax=Shewanella baltica (strain OS195) TaxID=399599 RepID=A9L286_SHEB9|nr:MULTISPECIES: hypothetical protein [Shewanella]ABX50849.1 conserved hypothetical protein [Shewanella baltica OS195]ACK47981.1 conserved hypothetical protein [Shewanella baltica OS223]ADT95848.1 hypothetical protein Sbal678_3715 [Shewanella baltica OS678]EHC07899.1 hypothetical protein Sbal625DRAFT_0231 [Shewanella baltica OS625]KZK67502.1 hypothetical protein A1L58_04035 [Shewanella baltica]